MSGKAKSLSAIDCPNGKELKGRSMIAKCNIRDDMDATQRRTPEGIGP